MADKPNSLIAYDVRTGEVLAAVAYDWDDEANGYKIPALTKKVFQDIEGVQAGAVKDAVTYRADQQAIAYLYVIWSSWVGVPFNRHYRVAFAAGTDWPNFRG